MGLADALDGWNAAIEGRDLAVMAAEAATSRALTAEEKILELEGLVASLKTTSRTKKWRHGGMVGAPRAITFFSGVTGIPAS